MCELPKIFGDLVSIWRRETEHQSSVSRMLSHPAYLAIIGLSARFDKETVLRLILKELYKHPDYWFAALEAITDQRGFHESDGDFNRERRAWLRWAKHRGYL